MKIAILTLVLCASSAADPWVIDDKTREECAKLGGCLITVPNGELIPVKVVNDMIEQMLRQAFEAGATQGTAEGTKTCSRRDV